MPYYDDFDELYKAVDERLNIVLKKHVAPVAEDILRQFIRTDIYLAYTPKRGRWVNGSTYEREYDLEESVYSVVYDDNTALITSDARAVPLLRSSVFEHRRPGAFLELLESGHMGFWKAGFPRPAVRNAQEAVKTMPHIKEAIRYGLDAEFS